MTKKRTWLWSRAKRPTGRPRLSTVACINDTIRRADMDTSNWINTNADRDLWHKLSGSVRPKVEKRGRRPAQAQTLQLPPPAPAETSLPSSRSTEPFLASSMPPRQRQSPTRLISQI